MSKLLTDIILKGSTADSSAFVFITRDTNDQQLSYVRNDGYAAFDRYLRIGLRGDYGQLDVYGYTANSSIIADFKNKNEQTIFNFRQESLNPYLRFYRNAVADAVIGFDGAANGKSFFKDSLSLGLDATNISFASHLLNVFHTKTATAMGATIDAINLGGHYSNTAGANPKVILYDDGGSIAGFGISSGQVDYIGYSTAVNHAFWAGATKNFTIQGDGFTNNRLGNITLGSYTTVPTISAIYMNVSPNTDNYTIARTAADISYINGDQVNIAINGSIKHNTNVTYSQYFQPLTVGSIIPTGVNAFVVSGESFFKGTGNTSATLNIKAQNVDGDPIFYVANNGVATIGNNAAGNKILLNAGAVMKDGIGIQNNQFQYFVANAASSHIFGQGDSTTFDPFVYISGTGRFGVGIAPLFKFQVNVGTDQNIIMNTNSGLATIQAVNDAGNANVGLQAYATEYRFMTGNFGVDTTPTAKLHARGLDQTAGNYVLKLDNSVATNLWSVANNGAVVFNSTLDGETSGNNNWKYSVATGGIRRGHYANTSYGIIDDYYSNNVLKTQTIENTGLYSIAVINRFSLKTLGDNLTRLFMDSTGNVGISNTFFTTSANLHIQGINTTSSNYSLKVDDSATANLFAVRNDGFVGIKTITPLAGESLRVNGAVIIQSEIDLVGASTKYMMYDNGLVQKAGFYWDGTDVVLQSNSGALNLNPLGNDIVTNNGTTRWAIGLASPTARLHVKGVDATAGNYALKLINSASTNLLSVRNDSLITIGTNSTYQDVSAALTLFSIESINTLSKAEITTDSASATTIELTSNTQFIRMALDVTSGVFSFESQNGGGVSILDTGEFVVSNTNGYDQFRFDFQYTPTSSADANGNQGNFVADDNYIYYKASTGWKRAALSTF